LALTVLQVAEGLCLGKIGVNLALLLLVRVTAKSLEGAADAEPKKM